MSNEQFNKENTDSRNAGSDRKINDIKNTPSSDGSFTAGNETPEIATNDGSVIETLDTALHGTPGWSEGENPSGSNRADYYEARSQGKSDSEEEMDELRKSRGQKAEDGSQKAEA